MNEFVSGLISATIESGWHFTTKKVIFKSPIDGASFKSAELQIWIMLLLIIICLFSYCFLRPSSNDYYSWRYYLNEEFKIV